MHFCESFRRRRFSFLLFYYWSHRVKEEHELAAGQHKITWRNYKKRFETPLQTAETINGLCWRLRQINKRKFADQILISIINKMIIIRSRTGARTARCASEYVMYLARINYMQIIAEGTNGQKVKARQCAMRSHSFLNRCGLNNGFRFVYLRCFTTGDFCSFISHATVPAIDGFAL